MATAKVRLRSMRFWLPASCAPTVRGEAAEGDAQADLDLPAGDTYLLHDQPEQALAALEIEVTQASSGPGGEVL